MIKVGIIGANGYLGVELIRILSVHPEVKLSKIYQREMEIEDSIMYDMSTWSIPLAYNLDAFWSENKIIANTTTIKKDLFNEKGFNDVENALQTEN